MLLVILSYVLSRSRTGFRRTDTIINRLIRGAIQTGLFASVFALADLFSFVLHRETYLYAMFAYPIGRIYTNVRRLIIIANIRGPVTDMTLFSFRHSLILSTPASISRT